MARGSLWVPSERAFFVTNRARFPEVASQDFKAAYRCDRQRSGFCRELGRGHGFGQRSHREGLLGSICKPRQARRSKQVYPQFEPFAWLGHQITDSLETLYTSDFNDWLESIPQRVKDLILIIKRRHRPEWGEDWQKGFSVDSVNGQPANELRYEGSKLITRHLRIGFDENGSWRLFAAPGLRSCLQTSCRRRYHGLNRCPNQLVEQHRTGQFRAVGQVHS